VGLSSRVRLGLPMVFRLRLEASKQCSTALESILRVMLKGAFRLALAVQMVKRPRWPLRRVYKLILIEAQLKTLV